MTLSWNEIKERAITFSKEWENDFNEDAEAKSFMDDFFNVFGIPRRRVASFEIFVRKEDGKQGFIDLLWKGNLLIEFKSRGKDLGKAHQQAKDYFPGLKDHELPKYILVSDFERFKLYDLEDNFTTEFSLKEFVNNVQHFGFIAGYQKKVYKEQDPANIKAAELMGKLHDSLEEIGYTGHPLEVYLVRILFCLFAEDTTIFNKQQFQDYIEQRTNIDGSDLAARLQELFQVLNTPKEKRFKNLDEQLADFPYVNGKLFEEMLPTASFDSNMRQALLNCCYIDWSKISPAIFGSMFQSVMNPKERRNLGAHYTSETNILKLIKPLFLDELWNEFESVKDNKNKLPEFHKKLSTLKFLDPACGCGNFLVITYREIRLLELQVIKKLQGKQIVTDINSLINIAVDQFYGIEYEEFPARIAEVAMWLIDHQMNMLVSNEFGQYFVRLPLKKSANIVHRNALQVEWESIVSKHELTFIIGNPPFIGKSNQNISQKKDIERIFSTVKGAGVMDYVSAWYVKAAQLMQGTKITAAFVSTNSITQGEQVGILWNLLFHKYNIKIHFAHRTFSWSNEAKGNAAVHVVIIGFANFDIAYKKIFEYENIKGEPHESKVKNINPYLLEGKDNFVIKRRVPICKVPGMIKGSMPNDGGYYLFTTEEKENFVNKEPNSIKFFKRFIGGYEFLNNVERWCLWLVDANPDEIKKMPLIMDRIEKVRKNRLESNRLTTQKDALTPMLFGEIRQTNSDYLALPEVSSENRNYVPIGYVPNTTIASNKIYMVPNASLFSFGILSSSMHNAWLKQISGRMKSDISYSTGIVYNNFPFPASPTEKHIKSIETVAQKVLDARQQFPKSSLAALYDPLTMPPALLKAHNELDKAVDLAYRPQPFSTEANRMEFLFELYEKYTADLFTKEKTKKSKKQIFKGDGS
jgi:hypothetical protein